MDDHAFRHPLLPERSDTLNIGRPGRRFKALFAESVSTDALTLIGATLAFRAGELQLTLADGSVCVVVTRSA